MYGYKCDCCCALVQVDPGEERICSRCEERREKRRELVRIAYEPGRREVYHAG